LSTVRSQLRAIFEKTCTRSQAEAVGAMLWVLSQRKPQGEGWRLATPARLPGARTMNYEKTGRKKLRS
ncbi:hypothetical protein ABTD77_19505, partial [Acinetobacter baumannii]